MGQLFEVALIVFRQVSPGGKSLKRGRQAVFFSTVNSMKDENGMGDTPCDVARPRIVPYKNTGKSHQNTIYWFNLKLVQEKGLLFYLTWHRERGTHEDEG